MNRNLKSMRVLVVGTGAIGKRHASNLAHLGHQPTALSMRADGVAGLKQHLTSNSYDAAVVGTATNLRLPVIELLASHKLPCYIEKPVAFRTNELTQIIETLGPLADRSFAGFMMRYHPAVQYLANVKDCYRFDFTIGHDVTQWRENWTFAGSYAADPNGGGVLLDLCHELDMAHTIVGALDIHSVSAVNHTDYPTIDFSTAIGASTQSAHGQIAMDYLSQISTRQTTLWGRSHNHYFDFAKDSYTRANADSSETLDLSIDRQKMFQNAMSDFLTVVAGEKPNNPLAPILSNEMASCHAICEAYENRTFVATLKGKI